MFFINCLMGIVGVVLAVFSISEALLNRKNELSFQRPIAFIGLYALSMLFMNVSFFLITLIESSTEQTTRAAFTALILISLICWETLGLLAIWTALKEVPAKKPLYFSQPQRFVNASLFSFLLYLESLILPSPTTPVGLWNFESAL